MSKCQLVLYSEIRWLKSGDGAVQSVQKRYEKSRGKWVEGIKSTVWVKPSSKSKKLVWYKHNQNSSQGTKVLSPFFIQNARVTQNQSQAHTWLLHFTSPHTHWAPWSGFVPVLIKQSLLANSARCVPASSSMAPLLHLPHLWVDWVADRPDGSSSACSRVLQQEGDTVCFLWHGSLSATGPCAWLPIWPVN